MKLALPHLLPECQQPARQFCGLCRQMDKGSAFRESILKIRGLETEVMVNFKCPKGLAWTEEHPDSTSPTNALVAAANGVKSIVKTRLLRLDRLSDLQVEDRLKVCRSCPGGHATFKKGHLHTCGPMIKSIRAQGRGPCGCILRAKARDLKEDCPFGYWPKLDTGAEVGIESVPDSCTPPPATTQQVIVNPVRERTHNTIGEPGRVRSRAERRERIQQLGVQHSVMSATNGATKAPIPKPGKKPSLYDWFGRVAVINLDRRPDRWERLERHLAEIGWPFRYPERFRAIDGNLVKPPHWWKAGCGAWGCHQSHVRILEQAMLDKINSLLVLEDDVLFKDGFCKDVGEFLNSVPDDWDQIYFGGQHLKQGQDPATLVNESVLLARNVNRTHAYAAHRRFMPIMYQHLTDYPAHAKNSSDHVDHRMGKLHQTGRHRIYAPRNWLCGQDAGQSNINGKVLSTRYWQSRQWTSPITNQPAAEIKRAPVGNEQRSADISVYRDRLVAVMGLYRGGTSCVAGLLSHLGVNMGDRLVRPKRANPTGFFEPVELSNRLRRLMDEPHLASIAPASLRIAALKNWLSKQSSKSGSHSQLWLGAKHPLFCIMGKDIIQAWGETTKFIAVYRPIEDSLRSLERLGWWSRRNREACLRKLWDAREGFLTDRDHLAIDFYSLLDNPMKEILRIQAYLGLEADPELQSAAADFVNADLASCRKGVA